MQSKTQTRVQSRKKSRAASLQYKDDKNPQQKPNKKIQRSINYTELRILKCTILLPNIIEDTKHRLLPGLQNRDFLRFKANTAKSRLKSTNHQQYHQQTPKLLLTAVDMISKQNKDKNKKSQQKYQQQQQRQQVDLRSVNKKDKRNNHQKKNHQKQPKTKQSYNDDQSNIPLGIVKVKSGQHQSSMNSTTFKTKHDRQHPTRTSNFSRLQQMSSDQEGVNNNNDDNYSSNNNFYGNTGANVLTMNLPLHKQKDFQLYDRILGQSDAVFQYVFGKNKKHHSKLINIWKQCLLHEDKTQIFIPINPQQNVCIPYTHPRVFPLNQLQKGFNEVYEGNGSGKHRCLKIGEESLIIDGIERYLKKCDAQPMKIARKDFDIISDVLADCKLDELENYSVCIKQIQGHFKIMATRWKYANINKRHDKSIESALANARNNFIDLGKPGVLADFLLKNSSANQRTALATD